MQNPHSQSSETVHKYTNMPFMVLSGMGGQSTKPILILQRPFTRVIHLFVYFNLINCTSKNT